MTWFTEKVTPTFEVRLKIKETLFRKQSHYQLIEVVETYDFGRVLLLDGCIQLSSEDHELYHHALAGKSFALMPNAARILILGGGDGALLSQVLAYSSVRLARVVEIDREVISCCQEFFCSFRDSFLDPRAEVVIDEGSAYVSETQESLDIIMVDAPDPRRQGAKLFRASFYEDCARLLNPGGVLAAQSESPYLFPGVSRRVRRNFETLFPHVEQTVAIVPSYPGGSIGFTFGLKV